MRRWWIVLGALAVLVPAGCGGSDGSGSGDGAEVEPASVVGETAQGLRLRIDVVGDREVSLRFPANCGGDPAGDGVEIPLHRRRLATEVDADGRFRVEESWVEDGTDGSEEHVDVRIDGEFADDGTATGTLDATGGWYDGQAESLSECETGSVAWTADRPPVEGDDLVVPVADPRSLAPAGVDVVTSSDSGEVVRIDAATGEAQRIGGEAAGRPPAEADPTAAPTTAGGPPTVSAAPIWMDEMAAVADGVWMVDPATGRCPGSSWPTAPGRRPSLRPSSTSRPGRMPCGPCRRTPSSRASRSTSAIPSPVRCW